MLILSSTSHQLFSHMLKLRQTPAMSSYQQGNLSTEPRSKIMGLMLGRGVSALNPYSDLLHFGHLAVASVQSDLT